MSNVMSISKWQDGVLRSGWFRECRKVVDQAAVMDNMTENLQAIRKRLLVCFYSTETGQLQGIPLKPG